MVHIGQATAAFSVGRCIRIFIKELTFRILFAKLVPDENGVNTRRIKIWGFDRSKSDVPVRKKYVYFYRNQFFFTSFKTTCAVLCPEAANTPPPG